jgi:tetratricopeptide (TPR) repeat protein
LFRAFLQLKPDGRNILLAAGVFAACAAMGLVGALLTRVAHTPKPETRLLFQGFEAGMLGYALYRLVRYSSAIEVFDMALEDAGDNTERRGQILGDRSLSLAALGLYDEDQGD